MDERLYSQFTALDLSLDTIDASQVSFRRVDNVVYNRIYNAFMPRGGSHRWELTGDVWGINSYSKTISAELKIPVVSIPIRHRRDGANSFFEKLDWSDMTWDAITLGSHTSPDISSVTDFAQIDETFVAAAGRLMKLQDIDTGDFERLGGNAPTTAPTHTLSAGALTGDFIYYYTFYDSTSGWESSPSPFTGVISPSSQRITLTGLATTATREGVDKKRIYRTVQTAEFPPLFRAEIDLAVASYEDNGLDDVLGLPGPDIGDHNPPPDGCYLVEAHQNRLWVAVGSKLYFSKSYDGNPVLLEYFSEDRLFNFNNRITSLRSWQGKLLVFTPPGFGIFEIIGTADSELEIREFLPEEGTSFPMSVATQDNSLVYWGATGPVLVDPAGVNIKFDRQIAEFLRPVLTEDYNDNVFISAVWHQGLDQFLFFFAGSKQGLSQWIIEGTTLPVKWINESTGATVDWELE